MYLINTSNVSNAKVENDPMVINNSVVDQSIYNGINIDNGGIVRGWKIISKEGNMHLHLSDTFDSFIVKCRFFFKFKERFRFPERFSRSITWKNSTQTGSSYLSPSRRPQQGYPTFSFRQKWWFCRSRQDCAKRVSRVIYQSPPPNLLHLLWMWSLHSFTFSNVW